MHNRNIKIRGIKTIRTNNYHIYGVRTYHKLFPTHAHTNILFCLSTIYIIQNLRSGILDL